MDFKIAIANRTIKVSKEYELKMLMSRSGSSSDEEIKNMNSANVAFTTGVSSDSSLEPKILVIGVGGAGGNAVNNMIRSNLEGVTFFVANTDAQALKQSLVDEPQRLQLGLSVTQGLGAGSKPGVGKAAAEESSEDISRLILGANMVFIAAGMGGGTGTGAAPVIARIAKEAGILTIGVVTKPFSFEGPNRTRVAEEGIKELQQYVDTLIVIPNQNLFRLANESTTLADAFKMADNVLYSGVRGITDLMTMPGLINLDFADIRAVMSEMGKAMMGTGESDGERRALDAAESAISNPLLDDVSLKGAKGILINIMGGYDMTLYEVDEAANKIREEVDPDANIIFGSTFDERLNGKIRVSVVATGIGPEREANNIQNREEFSQRQEDYEKERQPLSDELNTYATTQQNEYSNEKNNYPSSDRYRENEFEQQGIISQRKSRSFFERFGTKNRQQGGEGEPSDRTYSPNDDKDFNIPACFRRRK